MGWQTQKHWQLIGCLPSRNQLIKHEREPVFQLRNVPRDWFRFDHSGQILATKTLPQVTTRQHQRLKICRYITVELANTVSVAKIQITLLIVRRGALSCDNKSLNIIYCVTFPSE